MNLLINKCVSHDNWYGGLIHSKKKSQMKMWMRLSTTLILWGLVIFFYDSDINLVQVNVNDIQELTKIFMEETFSEFENLIPLLYVCHADQGATHIHRLTCYAMDEPNNYVHALSRPLCIHPLFYFYHPSLSNRYRRGYLLNYTPNTSLN